MRRQQKKSGLAKSTAYFEIDAIQRIKPMPMGTSTATYNYSSNAEEVPEFLIKLDSKRKAETSVKKAKEDSSRSAKKVLSVKTGGSTHELYSQFKKIKQEVMK